MIRLNETARIARSPLCFEGENSTVIGIVMCSSSNKAEAL
jgi:hypothetical protein